MRLKYATVSILMLAIIISALCFVPIKKSGGQENRTLATFEMVLNPEVDSVVYRESALERFEEAMTDQFYLRDRAINTYLLIDNWSSKFVNGLWKLVKSGDEYSFTTIGDYAQIDGSDYIINVPEYGYVDDGKIQIHINQIEQIHDKFPSIRFYSYYVTQANETSWFDEYLGTSVSSVYDQVEMLLPKYVKSDRLKYYNLEDYENCHYASDHHWNHNGVRRGYEDIFSMMQKDLGFSALKTPIKEWSYSDLFDFRYRGSYARRLGELYDGSDDFSAYEYSLPDRKIYAIDPLTFKEISLKEIGLFDEYTKGEIDNTLDHYIAYYGRGIPYEGEEVYGEGNAIYMIQNKRPETKHNLLIYGDSYNRALRDVLASHFDTTLYFQRDIMENYDDVCIDKLIEKYDIDVFLISGNSSIWTTDEYVFDFSWNEGDAY